MHKILISHEIPKALFRFNSLINDYPYVLAHLLWKGTKHYDEEYASFYKAVLSQSAYSILDNSCFELGSSIPGDILVQLYNEYKPSHLVLPDVMGNAEQTLYLTREFLNNAAKIEGSENIRYMAVLQGKTQAEYKYCWDVYNQIDEIEVIGVNYRDLNDATRFSFLSTIPDAEITKKIHLLGCNNPAEFKKYLTASFRDSIISVDTSSPIIHGWNLNKYHPEDGISFKPPGLLADHLDRSISDEELEYIFHNVMLFKQFVNNEK